MEVLPYRQYRVKIDGSRRVLLRNRKHLRKLKPLQAQPAVVNGKTDKTINKGHDIVVNGTPSPVRQIISPPSRIINPPNKIVDTPTKNRHRDLATKNLRGIWDGREQSGDDPSRRFHTEGGRGRDLSLAVRS